MDLVSIILQIIHRFISFWSNKKEKQKQENENRIRISESIKVELENNLERLRIEGGNTIFNKIAIDNATNSEGFALLDVKIQKKLAEVYNGIRRMETRANQITFGKESDVNIEIIVYRDVLLKRLPEIIKCMEYYIKSLEKQRGWGYS